MAGVYKFETTETEADREQRLRTQKTASDKERIQLLYLLKTGKRLRFSPASPCSRPDAGCPNLDRCWQKFDSLTRARSLPASFQRSIMSKAVRTLLNV